jgi:radical SAM superfamily enzyme YgiQ (UPF0313 family)
MKVLVINPPSYGEEKFVREGRCMQRGGAWTAIWAPISLATIAAVLRDNGMSVRLYDCVVEEITQEQLVDIASHWQPDMLVINSSTPSIRYDLGCADAVCEVVPACYTTAFGIHVSALPFESLQLVNRLDSVILGEPEYAIRDLALSISDCQNLAEKMNAAKTVKGIAWRSGQVLRKNPPRPVVEELDEMPFPAWDMINVRNYLMPFTGEPFLLLATGRGCPWHCTYCAAHTYYGRCLRLRSAKLVVDEIEKNIKEHGVREFLFWTEAFTMDNQYCVTVCDEILRRNLDISWVCNSRVDDVTPELLAKLREAGCNMIGYGIESGNPDVLKRVKKGITLEQIRQAVKWTKEAGLAVTGHLMVGFPGEDKDSIRQTAELARSLDLDFAQFYSVVPFPGSELFDEARKAGTIVNWDFMMFEQNYGVLHTGKLTPEEVMVERSKAYRAFYFRPSMVWKTLKRINSPKAALNFLKMVRDFLTWI